MHVLSELQELIPGGTKFDIFLIGLHPVVWKLIEPNVERHLDINGLLEKPLLRLQEILASHARAHQVGKLIVHRVNAADAHALIYLSFH